MDFAMVATMRSRMDVATGVATGVVMVARMDVVMGYAMVAQINFAMVATTRAQMDVVTDAALGHAIETAMGYD